VTQPTPERCITCSDEAVEAEVVAVDGLEAVVLVDGAHECVAVDLVPETVPGDVLLCHAGIALDRVTARTVAS
jgi:hydrogenase maturation factor